MYVLQDRLTTEQVYSPPKHLCCPLHHHSEQLFRAPSPDGDKGSVNAETQVTRMGAMFILAAVLKVLVWKHSLTNSVKNDLQTTATQRDEAFGATLH